MSCALQPSLDATPDATPNSDPDRAAASGARIVASPFHGPRPEQTPITLLVLHSISLPPGEYGGDAVERLFTGTLDCAAHPYYAALRGLQVSAHFFLRRDGALLQFVPCARRAWHAGVSQWLGRPNCNDYSIGIELEGLEGTPFDAHQYPALAALCLELAQRYPIAHIVGHEHIAPGRKLDPGPGFDWALLARLTGWECSSAAGLARPQAHTLALQAASTPYCSGPWLHE